LQTFYTTIGNHTKSVALPYQQPLPDVNSSVSSNWKTTGSAGYSHPGSGVVPDNGINAVFVLSITEATLYPSLDTKEEKRAYILGTSSLGDWYLRSPGESNANQATPAKQLFVICIY
jgi:hypothetical protein